jgi:hypothetical protein
MIVNPSYQVLYCVPYKVLIVTDIKISQIRYYTHYFLTSAHVACAHGVGCGGVLLRCCAVGFLLLNSKLCLSGFVVGCRDDVCGVTTPDSSFGRFAHRHDQSQNEKMILIVVSIVRLTVLYYTTYLCCGFLACPWLGWLTIVVLGAVFGAVPFTPVRRQTDQASY